MLSLNTLNIRSTAKKNSRKVAIITGATSGIGRAYATHFASKGYDLLITGRRRHVITNVATEIMHEFGNNVEFVIADLSKDEDVSGLLRIIDEQKNIEVLINNAGYSLNTRFSQDNIGHQMDMLKVHIDAPLLIIHHILPGMIERRRGIIINVSSLAICFPFSENAMYTSSKSFLKSFTESLHMDISQYGIRVQCICPGFTYSDFHRNFKVLKIRKVSIVWMTPSKVVDYSIRSLKKGQIICIPGFLNKMLNILSIVMPRSLYYLLALKIEKRLNHMVSSSKEKSTRFRTPAMKRYPEVFSPAKP